MYDIHVEGYLHTYMYVPGGTAAAGGGLGIPATRGDDGAATGGITGKPTVDQVTDVRSEEIRRNHS